MKRNNLKYLILTIIKPIVRVEKKMWYKSTYSTRYRIKIYIFYFIKIADYSKFVENR